MGNTVGLDLWKRKGPFATAGNRTRILRYCIQWHGHYTDRATLAVTCGVLFIANEPLGAAIPDRRTKTLGH